MAGRIRSIKPEILDDEACAGLSDPAWRLWVSSWVLADDHGNLRAGDRYLAANVWQDTGRSPRVAAILRELRQAGRLVIYEVGTDRYAHVVNWDKHQRIDNAGKPRVPGPDHEDSRPWEESRGDSLNPAANPGESPLDQRPRPTTNDQRTPGRRSAAGFDFAALYAAYPRKEGKRKGFERLRTTITTQEDYDRIARAVQNYAAKVQRDGTELRYVMHFATFAGGRWEDYADAAVSTDPGMAAFNLEDPEQKRLFDDFNRRVLENDSTRPRGAT